MKTKTVEARYPSFQIVTSQLNVIIVCKTLNWRKAVPSDILVTKNLYIFPTVKSALPMVAMLPTYTRSPLFSAVFLLYYSLFRRGPLCIVRSLGRGEKESARGTSRLFFDHCYFYWVKKSPAVFLKTRVCGGCSVSWAHKASLRSMLFCVSVLFKRG